MKLRNAIITAGIAAVAATSSVSAATYVNDRTGFTFGTSSEPSLQDIFDGTGGVTTALVGDGVTSSLDQNADLDTAAIWYSDEADVTGYSVAAYAGHSGTLGIYSFADPSIKIDLLSSGEFANDFVIYSNGTIEVDGSFTAGFGSLFGFFWEDAADLSMSYTQDSLNTNGDAMAVTYNIADGTDVNLTNDGVDNIFGTADDLVINTSAKSNNDWIIAFEDAYGGDNDYNDAVFYIEDMLVPAPATLALMGLGLLGLGYASKKRKQA